MYYGTFKHLVYVADVHLVMYLSQIEMENRTTFFAHQYIFTALHKFCEAKPVLK